MAAAQHDHLGPLDALFLDVEDDISHMHIGSCAVFAGPPPPFDDLVALVEGKLPRLPRYRQVVRFVPGGLGHPVWVDDPHFHLPFHVRHTALPAPGDEAALERLMGRLMSQALDRHRPLWEMWVVEGLEDDRWAIISKVHHCMVDGISGTDLMATLLDPDPDATIPAHEPWSPSPPPTGTELVVDALAELARRPLRQLRLLGAGLQSPRRASALVGEVLDGLRAYGDRLLAPPRPLSIDGAIGPHRRWSAARASLADVGVIRRAFGGSVNDVVLAAITGAFREVLLDRGDDLDGAVLRTLVPVSSRSPDDRRPNNQVTAILADLPVGIGDPVARLHALSAQMEQLKSSHQPLAGGAVLTLAELSPPVLLSAGLRGVSALLRRLPQRSVNTVTTNVPGPREALYALGREMLEYLPFVPLSQGVRLGVAILSYHGRVAFGVTGDYDTAPDTAVMAQRIEEELADLLDLARDHDVRVPRPAVRAVAS